MKEIARAQTCHALAQAVFYLCQSWYRLPCLLLAMACSQAPADTARLSIHATQPGAAGPVCVRAIIQQSDGSYVGGEWGNPIWPPITMRGKAMGPGTIVEVATGMTEITIGKGPDYYPQTIVTNLAVPGQTYTIEVALQPVLDLYNRGWRTGDAHAHFIHGEREVIRTATEAFTMAAAGGNNFISFAEEHLGSGNLSRQQMLDQWRPYQNTECQLWLGREEPKNQWGHHATLLYDPWAVRSSLPYHWGIHSIHEQGGGCFPVHTDRTYPGRYYDDPVSGRRQWFLFPANNNVKSYPLDALIGHLYDAWSGVSDRGYSERTLPPYFKLLSMGYRIPLMADSDFCFDRINNGEKGLGCWMTYYQLQGEPLARATVLHAMHQGRIMSTTGPLVLFTIDNAISGDTLPADGAPHTVRIQASHTFNPWTLGALNMPGTAPCQISEIDLYRNGQLIKSWNPNLPTATVTWPISETVTNSYYMARVLGNDTEWMAGYASPIYFDNVPRPRQPPVFKSLIQGRLYDARSSLSLTGTVSCVRYGTTNWIIPTDEQGRFQARVPIDSQLVATDGAGRQFTQDVLQYEPAYAFCHYMSDHYASNMVDSIEPFQSLIQTMRWEFPLGFQPAGSYIRTNLPGDASLTNFAILSAPSPISSKTNSEIVMLILDKTQVQLGDTINYAAIFRQPQGQTPSESLAVEWKGWDPNHPKIYDPFGTAFQYDDAAAFLIDLGGGFFLRQGSVVVPSWTANQTETTAALKLSVRVSALSGKSILEEADLLIPIGPSKRELLISSTWDGFPAGWGERGLGPCNFYREWTLFQVRYADYRTLAVRLNLNGQPITIQPTLDTAHSADADNAVFNEAFYYDGQCEPQYRNIPFRDPVRPQPPEPDFSSVPIADPPDTTAPTVVGFEPRDGDVVPAGAVRFYYLLDDAGLSGPSDAVLLLDGQPAATNSTGAPFTINVGPGPHSWQFTGFDHAGNQGWSPVQTLSVTNSTAGPPTTNADLVWVEDSLPEGAVPDADGGDGWNWIESNPAPFSGLAAHQSNANAGSHQHFFSSASATLTVNPGDVLVAYVFLDPANPPAEIMLQWNDGSWEHRAYWGASAVDYGVEGTGSRRFMGSLPPAGQWVRLEVPAGLVALDGSTLSGMAFTLFGGQATWDHAGKSFSPKTTLTKGYGGITVSWPSAAGQTYHVVYKASLTDATWLELSGPITATSARTTWTDFGSARQRFYLVVQ